MEIHNVFNNFSVLIRKLRRHHTQIHKPTTPRFDSNSPRRTGINRILPAHQLFDETPTFVKINPPIKLTNRTNKIHRASLWYHYLRCKHNQPTSKKTNLYSVSISEFVPLISPRTKPKKPPFADKRLSTKSTTKPVYSIGVRRSPMILRTRIETTMTHR